MSKPLAVVVGIGPGNGEALARRFSKAGYQLALLSRSTDLSSKRLFLLCISCIWFGCNNSAKEIVKEATIYGKERDVGLRVLGYYSSKFVLLALVSILQVSLFYWIVNRFTHLGGDAIEQWLLLSLAATTGVAMGLAISALATTEDLAATVVPMVLIPQIILAGLIAPLIAFVSPPSTAPTIGPAASNAKSVAGRS